MQQSRGAIFKSLVQTDAPVCVAGVIHAYAALLAQHAGLKSLYLSGAGISNAQYGLPDLGITNVSDVAEEVRRIASIVDLPLIVDGDTGWGGTLNIAHATKLLCRSGAAGVHYEDQSWPKRCGHRDGKQLITKTEMQDKLKAAVDAKSDPDFVIIARTDALAVEGVTCTKERVQTYIDAGVDMIFLEAATSLDIYLDFTRTFPQIPFLANMTEFGKTPLLTRDELSKAGIKIILYPLSAFRAMNQAALAVYQAIANTGTQKGTIHLMQTREELYDILNYYAFEKN